MLHWAMSNAVLEPLRTRFELVARDVTRKLAAISARLHELPEAQRPRLRAVLLDLEGLQLRLQVFVGQSLRGDTPDPSIIDTATRHQLDILEQVKAFAMLIGQIGPTAQASGGAMTGSGAAYRDDLVAALDALQRASRRPAIQMPPAHSAQATPADYWHPSDSQTPWTTTLPTSQAGRYLPPQAIPHPGLPVSVHYALAPHAGVNQHLMPNGYHIVGPAWPQPQQRPVRTDEPEEVDYYDRDEDDDAPRRRRRPHDEEPRSRPLWSGLRNFGSPALVLAALFAGGVAFANRMYSESGRGERLDMVEQSEPGRDAAELSERKAQGRLASEPPAKSRESAAAAERTDPVPPMAQIDSAGPSSSASPQSPSETAAALAEVMPRPSTKLKIKPPKPALDLGPPPAAAPRQKIEVAMVKPPAIAAKPVATKPAEAPAEPDVSEPNDGLFVPVLSTHKDANAAREAFIELQKQHLPLLGAKQSEVQMSSSENGTWYRLVVTPATSKTAATEICNTLSAEGYGRCWVKSY